MNLAEGFPVYNVRAVQGPPIGEGSMINYVLLIMAAVTGIVVLDEDPSGVSIQEWILFAVMVYAMVGLLRGLQKYIRDNL